MKKITSFILKKVFWAIMLSVICYSVSFFYISKKISLEAETVKESRGLLKSFEKEDEIIDELEKDYETIKDDSERIFKALPSKEEVINFIKELEAIAEKTANSQNLDISNQVEIYEGKKVLRLTISLLGTNDSLIEYLKALEDLAYYTKINSINFKETEPGKISTTLNVMVYIMEK